MLGMYIAAGATIPHTYGIFDGTARINKYGCDHCSCDNNNLKKQIQLRSEINQIRNAIT